MWRWKNILQISRLFNYKYFEHLTLTDRKKKKKLLTIQLSKVFNRHRDRMFVGSDIPYFHLSFHYHPISALTNAYFCRIWNWCQCFDEEETNSRSNILSEILFILKWQTMNHAVYARRVVMIIWIYSVRLASNWICMRLLASISNAKYTQNNSNTFHWINVKNIAN